MGQSEEFRISNKRPKAREMSQKLKEFFVLLLKNPMLLFSPTPVHC